MGSSLSKAALVSFEIFNELYVAVGSGFLGLLVLIDHGIKTNRYVGTFFITSLTVASLAYAFNCNEPIAPSRNQVVFVTGCDSGLGFTLALHCHRLGFTVVAGCLDLTSKGAERLLDTSDGDIKLVELDVTSDASVDKALKFTENVLDVRNTVLWAVINNAGVLVFGEFEWQTERLMQQQLGVNLMGPLRVTKAFCPLLRKYKARLINVSSHCASSTLPGLSVYGASKAGLQGFSDALRVEMKQYGVKVITLVPGSFITQSNIMANHMDNVYEMKSAFTSEQEEFYGPYFTKYNQYLSAIAMPKSPAMIVDPAVYPVINEIVLGKNPNPKYTVESLRYTFYHALFKVAPTSVRDYFVRRFMAMPCYADTLCN